MSELQKLIEWCIDNDYPLRRLTASGAIPITYGALLFYRRPESTGPRGKPHAATERAASRVLAALAKAGAKLPEGRDRRRLLVDRILEKIAAQ